MARHVALALLMFFGWSGSVTANPNSRIFFLDLRGKLVSSTPEGTDRRVLVDGLKGQPDGIAIDVEAGHIYWTKWMSPVARSTGRKRAATTRTPEPSVAPASTSRAGRPR